DVFIAHPLFRTLAFIDVRSGPIPTENPSSVVPQRAVTDQEPAVLSIFAPHAPLGFKWQPTAQRLAALNLQRGQIFWMIDASESVRGHHIIQCEPGVIEKCPISMQDVPVRAEDADRDSYGIGDVAQLRFVLTQLLFHLRSFSKFLL